MKNFTHQTKLEAAIRAAVQAGNAILTIYNTNFSVESKDDHSPLTMADKAAHDVISNELQSTSIPVLSEEGKQIPYEVRKSWKTLWIVDPLDGTKEFVKRNGEFTVNIALVENEFPVLGLVYVPVSRELYFAEFNNGAYKCIVPDGINAIEVIALAKKLTSIANKDTCRIVASRSHMSAETEEYVAQKRKVFEHVELVSKGSSLKFCLVAEGFADVYPRYAPTMEWDTAAGQVLVEEVGKKLIDHKTGERMRYNRENLLNNWFLVY